MPLNLPGPGSYIGLGEPIGQAGVASLPAPLAVHLAQPPREMVARSYRLPVLLTAAAPPPFLPSSPQFTFQSLAWRRAHIPALWRGPVVVIPAPFPPRRSALAVTPISRLRARSTVRPPTVVAAPTVPSLPVKPSIHLATWAPTRLKFGQSEVRPPTVLSPGWQIGARLQLSQHHRETIAAHSYRLPVVVTTAAPAFLPRPLRVTLGKPYLPRPLLQSGPQAANFVNAAPSTLPPVARRTTLAKPVQHPATRTRLSPPLTVIPAPLAAQVHPRATLAPYRFTGRSRSRLAGPTIVSTPAVPSLPVKPSLHLAAWSPTRLRLAQSSYRPPAIVGPPAVAGWQIAARYQLTAFPRSVPRVGFGGVTGPTIVDAAPDFGFALGLRIQLTAFPRPLYRLGQGRSFRLRPTVIGPFATPTLRDRTLRVTLARKQWQIRPTRSFRAAAVVGAAPSTPAVTGVNQDFASIIAGW